MAACSRSSTRAVARGTRPRGRRMRYAVGELLNCTRCVGAWSALGLVALRLHPPPPAARPRAARRVGGQRRAARGVLAVVRPRERGAAAGRPPSRRGRSRLGSASCLQCACSTRVPPSQNSSRSDARVTLWSRRSRRPVPDVGERRMTSRDPSPAQGPHPHTAARRSPDEVRERLTSASQCRAIRTAARPVRAGACSSSLPRRAAGGRPLRIDHLRRAATQASTTPSGAARPEDARCTLADGIPGASPRGARSLSPSPPSYRVLGL